MTVMENLRQIIFTKISTMNEDNTEEALISMITDNILKVSTINEVLTYNNRETVNDLPNKEIYLYCNNSLHDWTYERCLDIADAVKKAIKLIDAYIICNGNIISYNTLNDKVAYYCIDDKVRIVKLA